MDLPNKLLTDIWDYCRANNITDIDSFIIKMVRTAFTIEKYGYSPDGSNASQVVEKEVVKEIEKIVEVIKEVPVEKIVEVVKEVEVIKEVEKIVEVEKPIEVVRSPSSKPEKDIYGEETKTGTKGRFGSNLLD